MGYGDCYIAFLDILGFKSMVTNQTCDRILDIFSHLKQFNGLVMEAGNIIMAGKEIKMKIMSDSICFYVGAEKENALPSLIALCGFYQAELLNMEEPVFMRGAIVRGEIYARDDIMFGPGLTNAYLLEEKSAKYPRIIMTKQTLNYGNSDVLTRHINNFLFKDNDGFWVVNYFRAKAGVYSKPIRWGRIFSYVDSVLDTTVDASVREKYIYVRDCLEKNKDAYEKMYNT